MTNVDNHPMDAALYARFSQLTHKEMECFRYLLEGYSSRQIAQQTRRSCRTIESHINSIKLKLQCTSRAQLIASARQLGYLEINL